jgi:hypothetical protein
MPLLTSLVLVGAGLFLAFAGRRFVWFLIAAAGFLVAFWVVSFVLPGNSLVTLLLALVAGLAASFLMRGVTPRVLGIVGFILVGTAAVTLGSSFGIEPRSAVWVLTFLAGGIVGVLLAQFVLELGLVIITALGGAAMVVIGLPDLGLPTTGVVMGLIGLAVAVAGFVVQFATSRR